MISLCCYLKLHVIENVKTTPGNALKEPKTVFKKPTEPNWKLKF